MEDALGAATPHTLTPTERGRAGSGEPEGARARSMSLRRQAAGASLAICESREAELLRVLERVRELLLAQPLRTELPLQRSFEILELETSKDFHGYTHMRATGWQTQGDRQRALGAEVRAVSVRLRSPSGELLPVELILATFLHELAHTVTLPEMCRRDQLPAELAKLQPQVDGGAKAVFVPLHHSEAFYANFAVLLRAAEELGIYQLPSTANKLSPTALRRFDSIDLDASLSGFSLGYSRLFHAALGKGLAANACPLQVIITDASRKQKKLVTLSDRRLETLLQEAKKKLNLRRRPKAALDVASQAPVDDAMLAALYSHEPRTFQIA